MRAQSSSQSSGKSKPLALVHFSLEELECILSSLGYVHGDKDELFIKVNNMIGQMEKDNG